MEFILKIIVTIVVIILASKYMDSVHIKDRKAAIYTGLTILVVGFFVGWLLTLLFNVLTLGLFWLIGLGIITRTIAYAVVIEIVDKFRNDFETRGFKASLLLSVFLALSWGLVEMIV